MNELVLKRLPVESYGAFRRYLCEFTRIGGEKTGSFILHHDIPAYLPAIADDDLDPYVLAGFFVAMSEQRRIVAKGSVSSHLTENLEELSMAWARWEPGKYAEIRISADVWLNRGPIHGGPAVAAFSGGLDATHLAWNWSQRTDRVRPDPLGRLCFVQGFDIPLSDPAYEVAFQKAETALSSLGLKLDQVRTNFREVIGVNWEDCYGTAVASCLHFYKGAMSRGLIASGQPYDAEMLKASSPAVDVLYSSGDFRMSHHGAACDRTEKLREIKDWPEGLENLRVCWQKNAAGTNCGTCEKCTRTKLNFWAAGVDLPESFGKPLTAEIVRTIKMRREIHRAELKQILGHAKKRNLSAEIVSALEKRISMPLDKKGGRRGIGRWLEKLR